MHIEDYEVELIRAGAHVEGRWGATLFLVRRHPLGAIGAAIMALFVFAALFADLITAYDPLAVNASLSLAAPSAVHWMGADSFGRDVYSRIVFGARISLAVGIGSTLLGSAIGVVIGLTSGYLGGWVDLVTQRTPSSPSPSRSFPMSPASSVPIRSPCASCPLSRRRRRSV